MPITIRPLEPTDEASWRALWADYLTFYKIPDLDPKTTDNTWAMLTGASDDVFGFVAEADGTVVGFVTCALHATTWTPKRVCYLDDLFVASDARGQGAGRALIEAVAARAKADATDTEEWHRVYWRTAADNTTAQALYDTLAKRTTWIMYERD